MWEARTSKKGGKERILRNARLKEKAIGKEKGRKETEFTGSGRIDEG